jgi:outer membrane protein OmpA-like peptidoglycan-associated protein
MMDEQDEGTRTGVWVALGVVAFVVLGLIGALGLRQMNKKAAPAAPTANAAAAPAAPVATGLPEAEKLADVALTGEVAGTLFFASGSAALAADAGVAMEAIGHAVAKNPGKNVLISGFHDATGDPAKNAQLAKERAKAVREALAAMGVDRARMVMRKPELTMGGADKADARRVEVRLVDA